MGKHSKDPSATAFRLPGDFHLIAKLKIESEEEAVTYLTGLEKEMLGLPRSKHSVAISWRIKDASDALRTDGLEAAMSHLSQIPHLKAAFIKEQREKKQQFDAGCQPKYAVGLMRQVEEFLCDGDRMKVQEVWKCFPDRDIVEIKVDGKIFNIERFGDDRICEYEVDKEGDDVNKKTIKRCSFDRYVTKAREQINSLPQ